MSKNRPADQPAIPTQDDLLTNGESAAKPEKKSPAKRTLLQSMAAIERIMNRLPVDHVQPVLVWLNSQFKEPCQTSAEAVKEAMSRG